MTKVVLDASAILAVLQLEAGADVVADHLANAHVSAVNVSEVVAKLIEKGQTLADARKVIDMLAFTIEDFDIALGFAAGALRRPTKPYGLSLGDRACLATAAKLAVPVLTTDRLWAKIDIGVDVKVVR